MRLLALWAAVLVLSTPAFADGFHGYSWPGWKLSSSEITNSESGENNVRNGRVEFPMSQLIDGDPSTTWAYYEASDATWKKVHGDKSRKDIPRSVSLHSEKSIVADELWLMNGYNRRADLFKRNDRVVRVRIHLNGKPIKEVALSDKMGWHKIALPGQEFNSLSLDLTGIRKGTGPDNDTCLSELALYSRGKKIKFDLPKALVYTRRGCCGGTGHLITSGGKVLETGGVGEGASVEWSPDGRRVAGMGYDVQRKAAQVWIADAAAPRIVRRDYFRTNKPNAIKWLSNRKLQATLFNVQKNRLVRKMLLNIQSPV